MKKLPYHEGSWFAVPLRDGEYAVGLVARMAPRGRTILAYLFGPKRKTVPKMADVASLQPKDAIKCLQIGDLCMMNGEWPIIGESHLWERKAWPMPSFVRRDDLSKRAWRSIYSDSDPSKLEREESVPYDIELERDALYGYGAVELLMMKLLT
jgi:hypothetical protein